MSNRPSGVAQRRKDVYEESTHKDCTDETMTILKEDCEKGMRHFWTRPHRIHLPPASDYLKQKET